MAPEGTLLSDRNVVCHKCGKKGHLQRVCKSSARSTRTGPGKSRAVCRVEEEEEEEEEKEHQAPDLSIYIVKSSQVPHSPPIHVKVKQYNTLNFCERSMQYHEKAIKDKKEDEKEPRTSTRTRGSLTYQYY